MFNTSMNRWWTVVAGALGTALGAGLIMSYAFGILAKSMLAELGWSRNVAADLLGMFLLGMGIGLVALGWLIARFGIRRPTVIFVLIWGFGFAAVALAPASMTFLLILFFLIGAGGGAATAMPYTVAISGLFDKHRGLALGLVVAGSGVGAFSFPQIAERLVDGLGWRAAFAIIGLGSSLIAAAGLAFLVRTPPGVSSRGAGLPGSAGIFPSWLGSRYFWFIALPIMAISVTAFGMVSSYVFLFADRGIPAATVTLILSLGGLASLAGRLVVGYLLDRIFAPYVAAVVFALAALGVLLLMFTPWTAATLIGVSLISLALGAEADILAFLVSRYFSLAEFSRVVSVVWVIWAWAGGVGTAIISMSYRLTHAYTPALWFFVAIVSSAAILICFIGPYRYPVDRRRDTHPDLPR
ncbi:MAG: MFS transporter [Sphingobium sp.]|uniref:MFS transporter n=1 Tax=Sphingobium sp. TaxID=1912891 RepID=UPI0029BCDD01|nr:MFS transporter [Sphingobium sp.]MDX3910314.1 MFS transporter [Sphingobium sp.]